MIVKVAPLGERVTEVNVEAGQKIATILEIAEVEVNGRTIRLNNADANESTTVSQENSIIVLSTKMKGGR